jgi:hypothetical protein
LGGLRSAVDDLVAAAEDAVRPLAHRQLGRVEHARIIAESSASLRVSPPASGGPTFSGIAGTQGPTR